MQGPLLPSHVRVIPIRDAPCECLPPPFKCYVGTVNELPENCDTNGDVYTVLSVDWCDHPVQYFCWDGQWYPLNCNPEQYHIRLESNKSQLLYQGDLETSGAKVGVGSSWNTIYNVGGFTMLAAGDVVIPATGLYHMTASTRANHLVPIAPIDPELPPEDIPTWAEGHWSASIEIRRSSPAMTEGICDQALFLTRYPSPAPVVTPAGTIYISTDADNCIAADYYFIAGQTVALWQNYTDGVPDVVGSGIWISRASFTLRKVA